MSVALTLPPELERFVQSQVEAGLYQTPGEVIRDALLLLLLQDHEIRDRRLERLRAEPQRGIEQLERGEYRAFTDDNLGDLVADIKSSSVPRQTASGWPVMR
jgi:antitoxin ParD1/3/4